MKFEAISEIGIMERLDFDRSSIEAILHLIPAKGFFVISAQHTVIKIVGEVLPSSMLGVSVHEMLPEGFRDEHHSLVESVQEGHRRPMAEGMIVEGIIPSTGESIKLQLSVGMLQTLPDRWKGCRIGVVL